MAGSQWMSTLAALALISKPKRRIGPCPDPPTSGCFRPIADIADDLHCCSVAPKLSFAERVGRSYRRDHLFSMWGGGALLVFMGLLFLLAQFGGGSELVLWLDGALTILFLVWIALVWKWSRKRFLQRVGHRRRHTNKEPDHD
jgi:hypothetical protein